jgi:hypothetical protein
LRDFVSVFDFMTTAQITAVTTNSYGSVTDTEITTAVQNALDAEYGIFFPAGVYRINSSLSLRDGTQIYGAGKGVSATGTMFRWTGGSTSSMFVNPNPNTRIYNITFKDFTCYTTVTPTSTICFDLSAVSTSVFYTIAIDGFKTGVKFTSPVSSNGGSVYNRLYDVDVNCQMAGGVGFHCAYVSSNANLFDGCRFNSGTGGDAVGWLIEDSNGNQLIACHSDMAGNNDIHCKLTAIGAGYNDGNVIVGNRIEGQDSTPSYTWTGVYVGSNVRDTRIIGNYYLSNIDLPVNDLGDRTLYIDKTSQSDPTPAIRSFPMLYVNGYMKGGLGAYTTGGTDWNDATYVGRSGMSYYLMQGSATNGPGGSSYYYVMTFEYQNTNGTGNMTQVAIPYVVGSGVMTHRSKFSGTWSSWAAI